jgi:hypothetical protein
MRSFKAAHAASSAVGLAWMSPDRTSSFREVGGRIVIGALRRPLHLPKLHRFNSLCRLPLLAGLARPGAFRSFGLLGLVPASGIKRRHWPDARLACSSTTRFRYSISRARAARLSGKGCVGSPSSLSARPIAAWTCLMGSP